MIKIEIKKRNRQYGLFTWPYSLDYEMKSLLKQRENIQVIFPDGKEKKRKVSYKYRRFSVGSKLLKENSDKRYFQLEKVSSGRFKLSFA